MRFTQFISAFVKAIQGNKDLQPKNAAQRIYLPLLAIWMANMARDYRAGHANRGTPPKLRWKKTARGPSGFDISKIKNPEKYLSSHARAMAGLKRALAA